MLLLTERHDLASAMLMLNSPPIKVIALVCVLKLSCLFQFPWWLLTLAGFILKKLCGQFFFFFPIKFLTPTSGWYLLSLIQNVDSLIKAKQHFVTISYAFLCIWEKLSVKMYREFCSSASYHSTQSIFPMLLKLFC